MHSEESTMTAGRITVYGSCVARDTAREMEQREWSVERYIARQSGPYPAERQNSRKRYTMPSKQHYRRLT